MKKETEFFERVVTYRSDFRAGIRIYEDDTVIVFRQIGGIRTEIDVPDARTGMALLLVIHEEIKSCGLEEFIDFADANKQVAEIYRWYPVKLADMTEDEVPLVMEVTGWRGKELRAGRGSSLRVVG